MKKRYKIALIAASLMVAIGGGLYFWSAHLIKQASTSVVAQPTNPIDIPSEALNGRVNVLLLGSDARGNEAGRTDSMMLVSADTKSKHVSIISIPRDTRVNLPGIGLTKITHANAVAEARGGVREGTLASVQAASNLLGVTINSYAKINFEGFQKIIDAIGGLDVTLPKAVNDTVRDIHLNAGAQHLTGDQALRYARVRYSLPDGDTGRQRNQSYILSVMGNKILSLENVPKLPKLISIVHTDLMDTDLSDAQLLALATDFKGIAKENIKYFQLPGKPLTAHDPLVGTDLSYFQPEMAGVKELVLEAMRY